MKDKIKKCLKCSIELIIEINISRKCFDHCDYLCHLCRKVRVKEYNNETKYHKISTIDHKKIFFDTIGNACSCCGEDIWQFLTLDHVNNDGHSDLKNGKRIGSDSFHRYIETEDLSRFTTLCMNCNYSKGHNGFCSHKVIPKDKSNFRCVDCNNILEIGRGKSWLEVCKKYNYYICNSCLVRKSVFLNQNIDLKTKYNKKRQKLRLKETIIENYGGKCQCCGETDLLFLTIDHINGGGRKEWAQLKKQKGGGDFYRWLKSNGFPQNEYRLLCYNCNCCRSNIRKCYHQLIKDLGVKSISMDEYKLLLKHNSEIIKEK